MGNDNRDSKTEEGTPCKQRNYPPVTAPILDAVMPFKWNGGMDASSLADGLVSSPPSSRNPDDVPGSDAEAIELSCRCVFEYSSLARITNIVAKAPYPYLLAHWPPGGVGLVTHSDTVE